MQAVMLAAGMGKRLAEFTKNNTKCMVEVANKKLIDHAINALLEANIKRFVIVTGYKGDALKEYVTKKYQDKLELVFVENKDYASTNNIYSFYLAKDELVKDDTILLESDLIYESRVIKDLVNSKFENVAAVAKYESWMDGTVVTVEDNLDIHSFIGKEKFNFKDIDNYYKTVNIYKFSKSFLTKVYFPFLEAYMSAYGLDSYYETTLKLICKLPADKIKAHIIKDIAWYEIDDEQDLKIANVLFGKGKERYKELTATYGGFWRYSGYIDFAYLVNPYFPKQNMIDKLQYEYPVLIRQYPSGLDTQIMNASRSFNVKKDYLLVGNGAAELIDSIAHITSGTVGVNYPTFNEYFRCFKSAKVEAIDNSGIDYILSVEKIKKSIDKNDMTVIVNPENPSGYMLKKAEIISLAKYALKNKKKLLVDESFADFANKQDRYTLLDNDFLSEYPNVIIIKSISKSFGIPGLRLGLLGCSDKDFIKAVREDLPVWNINSFAEYCLQVYNLYAKDYLSSCELIAKERERMFKELSKISWLKVYPSSANYLMVDLKEVDSLTLCIKALDEHKLIIKDLSSKGGFNNKNFIRIAIRDTSDNNIILDFLRNYK